MEKFGTSFCAFLLALGFFVPFASLVGCKESEEKDDAAPARQGAANGALETSRADAQGDADVNKRGAPGEASDAERGLKDFATFGGLNDSYNKTLRDLSVSYHQAGDVASASGKIQEAQEQYEKALEGFATIVEQAPDDIAAALYLCSSYNNLGALAEKQIDYAKAGENYQKAFDVVAQVLASAPDYAPALQFLVNTYEGLCAVSVNAGDYAKGKEYYDKPETQERLSS